MEEIERRRFLNQTAQVRRMTAKMRFKNMWLDEFE